MVKFGFHFGKSVRWVNIWKPWERKHGSPLCGPYSVLCSQFRAHSWSPVLGSCSRHGNVTGFTSEFSCCQKGKDGEHWWKLTARTLSKEVELKECMCETPLPLSRVLATAMSITCPDLIGRLASTDNSPWSSQCWKGKTREAAFLTTYPQYPSPSCLPADSKILFSLYLFSDFFCSLWGGLLSTPDSAIKWPFFPWPWKFVFWRVAYL